MKKRVAIFPAGSEIGLEINNALKYSTHFEVVGLSSVPCHAEYVYTNYVEGLPFYTADDFIEQLNQIIEEYQLDFIYPAYDDVQLYLTHNQEKINAVIVTSDISTVEICRAKSATYAHFAGYDFIPHTYRKEEEIHEFPIFLKPDIGQGSQGAKKICDKHELNFALEENPDVVLCEYLPGEEYTVDCFTDYTGKLRTCCMRNRKRIRNGISVASELLPMEKTIEDIANTINSKLCFKGAWFFQVKKNASGQYRLLEIAPRIAGTMGMSRNTGVNYPLLTLFTMLGYPVDIIKNNYHIMVDRALISRYKMDIEYDTIYVDLDDTLIVNGKVNTLLVYFLYQTVNEHKRRILLTKHLKSVEETLAKHRLSVELFDEMIRIEHSDEKSQYIKEKKAIYIDDSFSERKKISEICNIPVFDCSEVEALIDWRV